MIANLAAGLLLAVSVSPLPELPDSGEPLSTTAYVDDLVEARARNGRLPADWLVTIESSPGCLLEKEAAEAWILMEAHAADDGIEFTPSWCYRNLATQRSTYRRNCPLVSLATDEPIAGLPPDAAPEPGVSIRVCSPPTAKPGNSNHGWGRATDLTVDGRLMTCDSDEFAWLTENAHLYGWVHPEWAACGAKKQEAWHWEWGGTAEPEPPPPPPLPYWRRITPY